MPRDNAGNYALPSDNPVVSGEVTRSTWANTTMDDIALALSNSLDRDGNGGMRAPLVLDGSKPTDPDHAISLQYILDLQDPADSPDPFPVYLLADGSRPLVEGYEPIDPQDIATKFYADNSGGGGGGSPLTTKGDLYGYSTGNDRLPVGADNWLIVAAAAEDLGLKYTRLMDIPLDPDDPGAGFPGSGGSGIQVPDDTPVPVGGMVTYANVDGDQAEGNPSVAILGGHKLESIDGQTLDISALLAAGTTLHILGGAGGPSMRIEVPAGAAPDVPMKITSEGAALEVDSDVAVIFQGMTWDMRAPVAAGGYVTAVDESTLQLSAAAGPSTPEVVGGGFFA